MGVILDLGNGNKVDSDFLASDYGLHLHGDIQGMVHPSVRKNYNMAADAQPTLITTSNAGVPAYMTNYLVPELIRVVVTPMKCAEIVGSEIKRGSWVDKTMQFGIVESTGEVTSYGDNNENGSVGVNLNWEPRDAYLYQTVTQWGELELETAGTARVDLAAQKNIAAALVLNKFQNKSYFFGVAGLRNYGLLNDPSLLAPISPAVGTWAAQDAQAIYTDIQRLYAKLVTQTKGLIERDSPMTLALSPASESNFTKTNVYNVNVSDQIKKNFPNLRVEVAIEYATTSGELVQLIANNLDGQQTAECAFNEKLRAHAVVVGLSNFKQKKTGGTFGTIIKQPAAIAQLLGV